MMGLLDNWFSEYLIVFDDKEYIRIEISQDELRGLMQENFFRELDLNLKATNA